MWEGVIGCCWTSAGEGLADRMRLLAWRTVDGTEVLSMSRCAMGVYVLKRELVAYKNVGKNVLFMGGRVSSAASFVEERHEI